MIQLSETGRILWVNDGCKFLLGYSPSDYIDAYISDIMDVSINSRDKEYFKVYVTDISGKRVARRNTFAAESDSSSMNLLKDMFSDVDTKRQLSSLTKSLSKVLFGSGDSLKRVKNSFRKTMTPKNAIGKGGASIPVLMTVMKCRQNDTSRGGPAYIMKLVYDRHRTRKYTSTELNEIYEKKGEVLNFICGCHFI